ncbi:hypothetical protein GQ55_9G356100 [Panicum hallii var. hallii]|uniref:Uncharacterized protein n=1 Tax=Panicum hallii var. hallii TaxID=1504633 RepID=A0A2T7C8M8_9POAL|nr:hypothetical protein GQ55_9G356100 [Panicum hallii var. hallii]
MTLPWPPASSDDGMPIPSPILTRRPAAAARLTRLLPFSPPSAPHFGTKDDGCDGLDFNLPHRGGLRLRIWLHRVLCRLSDLPKAGYHDQEREGSDEGRNGVVPT